MRRPVTFGIDQTLVVKFLLVELDEIDSGKERLETLDDDFVLHISLFTAIYNL